IAARTSPRPTRRPRQPIGDRDLPNWNPPKGPPPKGPPPKSHEPRPRRPRPPMAIGPKRPLNQGPRNAPASYMIENLLTTLKNSHDISLSKHTIDAWLSKRGPRSPGAVASAAVADRQRVRRHISRRAGL